MSENGRNAANQLKPAQPGNRLAVTHGAYATFTPAELEEIRALEDEIRAACPVQSPSVRASSQRARRSALAPRQAVRLSRRARLHARAC